MDKGKGVVMGRRWAVDFTDINSATRDFPHPPVFEPYKDNKVELLGPKLLFIAINLGGLALGLWKLNTLGLLPTHASDWVLTLPPAQEVEYSGGGAPLH